MPFVYINPPVAEAFNRGLYRFMRPDIVRDPADVTDMYCPIHYHPSNGWAALELPDEETVPIHMQADGSEIRGVLDIFVADGALTEAEADAIVHLVIDSRGQRIKIADFVPASWQSYVFNREEMEVQGWFPKPELI